MSIGIGFFIVLACVFGAFAAFGGNIGIVAKALPHEFVTIGGGAIGAFVVANSSEVLKKALKGMKQAFGGEKWKKDEYSELLCLMYMLSRQYLANPRQLEPHIEAPKESSLFQRFPKVAADEGLVGFITDYLRMMSLNVSNPHQLAEIMEAAVDRIHHEKAKAPHALQNMADGLPAIGIVAAVLGVINTMGSIDQPTEILGGMIGSALVGTFLGVLLSYCVVGPMAARLQQIVDADIKAYDVVRSVLIATAQRLNAIMAVEVGRQSIPSSASPSFIELENMTGELPRVIDGAGDAAPMAKAA